jgi:hypothetical protein
MFHGHVRLCGAITLNKRIFWSKEVSCAKRVSSCALTKDIFMDLMTITHMLTAGITTGFMFRYLTSCASHLEETCYRFSSIQLSLLVTVPWTS